MKNSFKLGFLGLALSLSVVACSSDKKADGADTTVTDSTVVDTTITTTTTDTSAVDTTMADTTKKM
ncbi:hypothetical protein EZ449_11260 [Pedobacter frigidisoli]|uniref:Entericidin n=1 Tax=Pedobacter frigidisoli TaxID=2530455 RepID=A0A4R0P2W1_9SPHI|nr:hypothetical protein [Pedobacter frigidisoli]TCD08427.1 hypothetical protein EZ449_11260 [Pedobacter frigidisoli]